MARRSDLGKKEDMWSSADLKEISPNLAVLSEHAVREAYQRAYRECAIIMVLPSRRRGQFRNWSGRGNSSGSGGDNLHSVCTKAMQKWKTS